MQQVSFHNRRAVQIENEQLRLTITEEGGHIAEVLDKQSRVNPLWIPPWPSIEPSIYRTANDSVYGANEESRLLSGIMGHNLCLGLFGPPSKDESAAGIGVHGEASVLPYRFTWSDQCLTATCELPLAQLAFTRRLRLSGSQVFIEESVENLSALDQPIGWTQHVTLGPPFLIKGKTQFRVPATRSVSAAGNDEFMWPLRQGSKGVDDRQIFTNEASSGSYTAHLLDAVNDTAWFTAWSPDAGLWISYQWQRKQFPWIGMWEENHSRTTPPWNGRTLTCGLEFGVSPFPETRRAMIDRAMLFDTPAFRWLEAKATATVQYRISTGHSDRIPESLEGVTQAAR